MGPVLRQDLHALDSRGKLRARLGIGAGFGLLLLRKRIGLQSAQAIVLPGNCGGILGFTVILFVVGEPTLFERGGGNPEIEGKLQFLQLLPY